MRNHPSNGFSTPEGRHACKGHTACSAVVLLN
uniref:Uncharacterized protein n=1 Tax=Anguilla anguilla TaxID=7936 RepID=A0A0E9TZM5_ANGAN